VNPLAALLQLRRWLVFSGGILCVFVLAKAAALFVPIVIAVLIAFLLAPLVSNLQRRIGRIPAVMVIALSCTV
jgi:predicted PurR-regulated permease PerM